MNDLISKATANNWSRLNTKIDSRLTTRANKRRSTKKFIPFEYISHDHNIQAITTLVEYASRTNIPKEAFLYTIACILLKQKGILDKKHVQYVLSDYPFNYIREFENMTVPEDEKDLLGVLYQSIQSEGDKNIGGSYYTPSEITEELCKNIIVSDGQKILDPCCGSGAFLLSVAAEAPESLYGFDIDTLAVMLTKVNLLLKYCSREFVPNIYQLDYLQETELFSSSRGLLSIKFDYIITNPPWGAMQKIRCSEITSGETFSYFFIKAFSQLADGGIISFLFPESIANIKAHSDIRKFILHNTSFESMNLFERIFTGVLTKHIAITCKKSRERNASVSIKNGEKHVDISLNTFLSSSDFTFTFASDEYQKIIDKIRRNGQYSLEKSDWALGIVTGNNKELLHEMRREGEEPIYTGKEIAPYVLKKARYCIKYDRKTFQQAAKDEYYRSEEKLVYKFISKKLVFSYDNNKSLLLNSANMLIPHIPNMSIKTVLAYLNSDVLQFYYAQKFDVLKVLKSNLLQIPFPEITSQQNSVIEAYVNQLLQTNDFNGSLRDALENEIFCSYKLTSSEIRAIKEAICRNC